MSATMPVRAEEPVSAEAEIIGDSPALQRAVSLARRFAPTPMPILLVGATGTGKELFAQNIHAWSGRRGALVDLNCGALPKDMIESLLFGHRRGAFTGAVETVTGLIEGADGGTLFLDELSSLPPEAQVKLLRVLEQGEVRRLGDARKRTIAFRLIATVQEDLGARVAAGAFRLDLLQRAAGVVIELPALAERGSDVSLLATHFAERQGRSLGPGVAAVLEGYRWPGNVREMKAAVDRAVLLGQGPEIGPAEVVEAIELGAPAFAEAGSRPSAGESIVERDALLAACQRNAWNLLLTAEDLGVSRSTLYRRLRRLGLSIRRMKGVTRCQTLRATL